MNDTERAIETIKMENELMQFDPNTGEDYPIELQNQDNQDLYNANLVAISALEKQLNGGWIPVSERLPTKEEFIKNDSRFIVTDGQRVYQSLYDMYEKQSFVEVYYKGNCNLLSMVDERVIAWQPMPEKYKGE